MVNSVEKMTNDIIYLIIGLIILASVFGAIAGTFYTSWTGVNMTALGGDDTTQTTWDLVPRFSSYWYH